MSFTAFSKEFGSDLYTSVENQFITKYLPCSDGDAVRAYLYGLYLCGHGGDLDAESCAKLLKIPYPRFLEIFGFWEECGLCRVLSKEPLVLEYLPVRDAVGKPKPMHPEKYQGFSHELLRKLQKADAPDLGPYEMQKVLRFLEDEHMEPQAFLLVAEACIKRDGGKFSYAHCMNAAKKLAKNFKLTYEQVSGELAHINLHEKELKDIFSLLGVFRAPRESDFDLFSHWKELGLETDAIFTCAKSLKKGSLSALDRLCLELAEKKIFTRAEAEAYLARREELCELVFALARKLGVKVQNPRAYIEEYAEKWVGRGLGKESLLPLAGLCFKLRYGFAEMDALLETLYRDGTAEPAQIKAYCAAREKQFRLLQSIQSVCGVLHITPGALDQVAAFRAMGFSNEMILEAAKRAASAAAPLPYMNKMLTEWQRTSVFSQAALAKHESEMRGKAVEKASSPFKSEAAIALDKRTEREQYYAKLTQQAISRAEAVKKRALEDERFRLYDGAVKRGEIELARAELTQNGQAEAQKKLEDAKRERAAALHALGLLEEDLLPKFRCPKCSDTGFLPDGALCDCYPPQGENARKI